MDLSWDVESYCRTYSRQDLILITMSMLYCTCSCHKRLLYGFVVWSFCSLFCHSESQVIDDGKEVRSRDWISALDKSWNAFFFSHTLIKRRLLVTGYLRTCSRILKAMAPWFNRVSYIPEIPDIYNDASGSYYNARIASERRTSDPIVSLCHRLINNGTNDYRFLFFVFRDCELGWVGCNWWWSL